MKWGRNELWLPPGGQIGKHAAGLCVIYVTFIYYYSLPGNNYTSVQTPRLLYIPALRGSTVKRPPCATAPVKRAAQADARPVRRGAGECRCRQNAAGLRCGRRGEGSGTRKKSRFPPSVSVRLRWRRISQRCNCCASNAAGACFPVAGSGDTVVIQWDSPDPVCWVCRLHVRAVTQMHQRLLCICSSLLLLSSIFPQVTKCCMVLLRWSTVAR